MKKSEKGQKNAYVALGKVLAALSPLEEKDRSWVVASAVSSLSISATTIESSAAMMGNASAGAAAAAAEAARSVPGKPGTKEHAKGWLRGKAPFNDLLRVACLGYYLLKFKDTPTFKTKDISAMNTEAAGTHISNASRSLDDATNKGKYFAPAGSGKKQLTGFGEEVVEALPDKEKLKEVEMRRPKKKKKGKKKAQ